MKRHNGKIITKLQYLEREVIKIEKKERETMQACSQKKQATKSMIHAKNVNTIQSQLRDHELCKKI